MSVPTEHTAVMLMLCVTTPRDPISALAKLLYLLLHIKLSFWKNSPGHHQNWLYDFLYSDWLTQTKTLPRPRKD